MKIKFFIHERYIQNSDAQGINLILKKGIWYTQDYYHSAVKANNQGKIQFLMENDYFLFHFGHLSSNCFKRLDRKENCSFILKEGIKPSVALESIKNSFDLLDCGAVYTLVFYRALKDYLGVDKFDTLFTTDPSKFSFLLSSSTPSDMTLFLLPEDINNLADLKVGDRCHFSNIGQYRDRHPHGEAVGYNVLYIGNSKFLGFGLSPGGKTAEEVEQSLFNAFNKPPLFQEDKKLELTWEQFKELQGSSTCLQTHKLSLQVMRPRIDNINTIATMTLEDPRFYTTTFLMKSEFNV